MPDPRFFTAEGPFTLSKLAETAGSELAEAADPTRLIRDVAPLDEAGPDELSFLDNTRYLAAFRASRAGACVVRPAHAAAAPAGMALILSDTPYKAYALIAQAFYPEPPVTGGVAADARIDPGAEIGAGTEVAAGAIIGPRVRIGERCRIGGNAVIAAGVVIGDDCAIGASASLTHCLIGDRVRIFAGARIGEAGFGFAPDQAGPVNVPQLGRVVIHDDVEIGANTTIDRGSGPDTVIGPGCRIDNLVQIGHNVRLGRGCIVVAQAGISGSTQLADFVVVAAQGGLAGHLRIGKGAQIAAQSGVMRDVPAGASVCGAPAVPIKQFFRQTAVLGRLARNKGGKDETG